MMNSRTAWAAALALLVGCSHADAEQQEQTTSRVMLNPDARRVEVAALQPSDTSMVSELPGEVRGSEDAMLGAARGGYVEKVPVDPGDEVAKGDLLVSVDRSTRYAEMQQANARRDLAKASLSRVEKLGDLASDSQLDQAKTEYDVAEANARLAQLQYSRAAVRAPFDGVVGVVNVSKGEIAGPGAPLVRLVRIDPIEILVSVSDRDVAGFAEGETVQITTPSRGEIFEGTVSRVHPVANQNTRAFAIEVEVPNPDRKLLPGMIAKVKVERTLSADTVSLPQDWLLTRRDDYGVFVEVDGTAHWKPVTLAGVIRGQAIVASGVTWGDRVIMAGQHDLVDGEPILVAREGTCCTDGRPTF